MVSPGRVAFTIGGLDVMWYGITMTVGIIAACAVAKLREKSCGIKKDFIYDIFVFCVPAGVIGARLYYVIFEWERYANNLKDIFNFRGGGLAIHGGLIAGFIVGYFVCKKNNQHFLKAADWIAASIPLAQAIARWGNFFNSEAHGGPTDLPWAQIIDGVGYHPTFLYESIWCLLLFIFLIWYAPKKKYDGEIVCLYMILYSIERFFVEGLRTDSLWIGALRQAQVISIVLIAAALILMPVFKKISEKQKGI